MALPAGSILGTYEITSLLGKGGMGEVYRARDTRLKREVAIKILPDEFSRDRDRLSRFQREAEVLAQLNHSNIAAIYDLQESKGVRFLILELVEGETLAERIARGPLAVDDALDIAKQICEAVEAAHEKGIVHRDLKPANVKIQPGGKVKVLDFGLAKAMEKSPSNSTMSNSPTLSLAATNAGVIIGTAAYMSPEQARGLEADQRSDVFAFGCVLYEMLSGKAAFDGDTVSDVLASVLAREPDLNALPADVPPGIRALIRRCLQKNPKRRWQAIGDVRYEIDEVGIEPPPMAAAVAMVAPSSARRSMAIAGIFILTTAALAAFQFYGHGSAAKPDAESIRFTVSEPEKASFESAIVIGVPTAGGSVSPDGRRLAFTARDSSGKLLLWIRSLDALVAQPLPGTEGAGAPFWSPDSRFVGFFAQSKLRKIDISGGSPQVLCDAASGRGGTWNRDGTIVFAPSTLSGLSRVSSAGGETAIVTRVNQSQTYHRFPFFLPDGRHYVYFAGGSPDSSGIYVGALDSGDSRRLFPADSAGIYASPGYLLFVRQGTLFAQPFDATNLQTTGDPMRLAESIPFEQNAPAFSVSDSAVMTYRTGPVNQEFQLAWFDRKGQLLETVGAPGGYLGLDRSPDGKRIAVHRHDANGGDVWVFEPRGRLSRLTFNDTEDNSQPIWSPDGKQIAFAALRNSKWGLYQKASDGTNAEELLVESELPKVPVAWSPDGNSIVFSAVDPKTSFDLWLLPLKGERKPTPLLNTSFGENHAQISPDGRWMAYNSNQTGRNEVYVQPFPSGTGRWQVSISGGLFPRWRADGKELFYFSQNGGGKVVAAAVNGTGATFNIVGVPEELFDTGYLNLQHPPSVSFHPYAVSPDGQRFLIPRPASNLQGKTEATPITVVLNWTALLKK